MVQSTAGRVLNGADLERQIEADVRNRASIREARHASAAPASTLSMPHYVQHCEGATEIGKLSAEAVAREYEAAAKDIEGMGAELIERAKQCETMTRDALAATKEMKETAARYREQAKRIFIHIEECSLITAEVRKTCTALKERIAAPPSVPS